MASAEARILVVDDHLAMAQLLCDQLGDTGYAVEAAGGGEAALAAARARPPDLVITDLRMEKVDGFDVLDGVRAIDPTIPVLIMTAYGAIDSASPADAITFPVANADYTNPTWDASPCVTATICGTTTDVGNTPTFGTSRPMPAETSGQAHSRPGNSSKSTLARDRSRNSLLRPRSPASILSTWTGNTI